MDFQAEAYIDAVNDNDSETSEVDGQDINVSRAHLISNKENNPFTPISHW